MGAFRQLQTVMGAEGNTAPAVDAHKRLPRIVEVNRIHRAGLGTVAAADTKIFFDDDAAALACCIGTGRTDLRTGGGAAGQAGSGFKTGGHAAA